MDNAEKLLDPLASYYSDFFQEYQEKSNELFEQLVKESGVDAEANRRAMEELRNCSRHMISLRAKLHGKKTRLFFARVLNLIGLIISFFSIRMFYRELKWAVTRSTGFILGNIFGTLKDHLVALIFTALIIFLIVHCKKDLFETRPQEIDELRKEMDNIDGYRQEQLDKWKNELRKLTNLFDAEIPNRLIREVIPTIALDDHFEVKRYLDLTLNYGMENRMCNDNTSLNLISGSILGNSFLVYKTLRNEVYDETYRGERTITYYETYYDSDGHERERSISQTLRASIVRPKQKFYDYCCLVYGNDAADRLEFRRDSSGVHQMSDWQLSRFMKKQNKEIRRKSEEAIRSGGSFTELPNEEFETLFNALNRNDEVGYRVMFTPIAQKNMVALLKDPQFGDTFTYIKYHKLNKIINWQNWVIDPPKSQFDDSSFDVIKKEYLTYLKTYFKEFYKLFLPILSIPVLCQHKAQSFIYEDEVDFNFNPFMSEMMANEVGADYFRHELTNTQCILKTTTVEKRDDIDRVQVDCFSYQAIPQVEYVPVRAGDGCYYDVPVHWVEYRRFANSKIMELENVGVNDTEFETMCIKAREEDPDLGQQVFAYKNGVLAKLIDDDVVGCKELKERILGGNYGKSIK